MSHKYTNRLAKESSPYLLQHAHNPVNWYPWGNEAFEKARAGNKLLLISIGYSSCHWCHVMERESFENEEIADLMNRLFVNIKVDREERPDVDQVYMEAVQKITGSGGWPLNCFVLPDGRPVYGGTYFRPDQFKSVLELLYNTWQKEPQKVYETAEHIKQGISDTRFSPKEDSHVSRELFNDVIDGFHSFFDFNHGGYRGAPKFPMPNSLWLLSESLQHKPNEDVESFLALSLRKMFMGGIYDHVGGGFARYAVDERWKVPHFEKMLYDNAQLIDVYTSAYQRTKNPLYKYVVAQTIGFIAESMQSPNGGFYSALDADSEGVEGKFYVWSSQALHQLLGDKAREFCAYYSVTEKGNWEGSNILHIQPDVFDESQADRYSSELEKLKQVRAKRIWPQLDDKIITSWNTMLIAALARAYGVFGNDYYKELALEGMEFIVSNQLKGNTLLRIHKNGESKIAGFLDDYAFTIDALMEVYQLNFDEKYLLQANAIAGYVTGQFYNSETGLFYYTAEESHELVVRKTEIQDNVIPSSNSVMANNLFRLSAIFENLAYEDMAVKMLSHVSDKLTQYGPYFSNWSRLLMRMVHHEYEITVSGKNAAVVVSELSGKIPHAYFTIAAENSQLPINKGRAGKELAIYVCRNKQCSEPVSSVQEVMDLLNRTGA